jgi:CheY-like chemotaxis protein
MHERTSGQLVYVVDDEPIIATTLAAIIKTQGFDTRSFNYPLEALESARSLAPDLLLSDVIMPDMTGVELAIRLRQLCPECKVVLLSGQGATGDLIEKALDDGHRFDVLTKPLHPSRVLDAMRRLLGPASGLHTN